MAGFSSRKNGVSRMTDAGKGREDGYRAGWEIGYWNGKCESVMQHAVKPVRNRPIHVLYVATGKGYPYSALDEALSETLRGMVGKLSVTDSHQQVAKEAARLRPDLVLVLDGINMDTEQIDAIRGSGIRTAIWFTDDPYYMDVTPNLALHYDVVFTLERNCIDFYRAHGCSNVYYLPLAAYPAAFRPRSPVQEKKHEICFVGTAFWNRIALIEQVGEYLASKDTIISGLWWDRLENYPLLADKIELGKWMSADETAEIYSGAKIVINMHRAFDDKTNNVNSVGVGAVSPNPRTFEIGGCAVLQLTDVRDDLSNFYVPGVEIETYATPEELVSKLEYYLAHEEERKQIALRGLYRTMRDHTYARRLDEMLGVLFD